MPPISKAVPLAVERLLRQMLRPRLRTAGVVIPPRPLLRRQPAVPLVPAIEFLLTAFLLALSPFHAI